MNFPSVTITPTIVAGTVGHSSGVSTDGVDNVEVFVNHTGLSGGTSVTYTLDTSADGTNWDAGVETTIAMTTDALAAMTADVSSVPLGSQLRVTWTPTTGAIATPTFIVVRRDNS